MTNNSNKNSKKRLHGGNSAFHNVREQFAHIEDPEERRKVALAELDNARFSWYHVRTVAITGIGFFTDAYDLFAINMVSIMLGFVFNSSKILPQSSDTAIKVATSIGTVIGQLLFGWLADTFGRQRVYGVECCIILGATLAQSLVAGGPAVSAVGLLTFWRVVLGVGIGGDYPVSSIITSEYSLTRHRGAMIAAVFAMQGFGQLGAALVALIATQAFQSQLKPAATKEMCGDACLKAIDRIWRIVIGFGGIPACVALYYRLTMPETPRYTFDVNTDCEKNRDPEKALPYNSSNSSTIAATSNQGDKDQTSWTEYFHFFSHWSRFKILFGTAMSWLLLDVAFYGLSLNNSLILKQIGYSNQPNVHTTLYNNAAGNLILICAGALPGYWLTVFTVDWLGRKTIQIMGFTCLTIIFLVLGITFNSLNSASLLALYALCQFFFNFGPNTTTFIVPAECFPTRYRSTSHGISAASGKIGAIIAQLLIGPLRTKGASKGDESPWLWGVMLILAGFMAAGWGTSWLIPETKRKTLEELADAFFIDDEKDRKGKGRAMDRDLEVGCSNEKVKAGSGETLVESCGSSESSHRSEETACASSSSASGSGSGSSYYSSQQEPKKEDGFVEVDIRS